MEDDVDAGRQVIGGHRRDADAEVDDLAVPQLLGAALGDDDTGVPALQVAHAASPSGSFGRRPSLIQFSR